VKNHASEKLKLLNFQHSREKSSGVQTERSAPGTQASLAPTPLRGVMPPQAACLARVTPGS
jgi:hypothetical protein